MGGARRHVLPLTVLLALAAAAAPPSAAQPPPAHDAARLPAHDAVEASGPAPAAQTRELSVYLPEDVRVAPGASTTFTAALAINPEYHIMANPAADGLVPTTLSAGQTDFLVDVVYPEGSSYSPAGLPAVAGEAGSLGEGTPPIPVYGSAGEPSLPALPAAASRPVELTVTLTAPAGAAPGQTQVPLNLMYQACTSQTCLRPVNVPLKLTVEVLSRPAEEAQSRRAGTPAPATAPARVARPPAAPPTAVPALGAAELAVQRKLQAAYASGLPWMLLAVFLLGLGLNLTPCVFPLLPITMGFFAAQGEHRAGRTFPMALVYVLSLAAFFTALGMSAAFLGSLIGAALQSLYGRAAIAVTLLLLAASLFGAFEIRLPTGFLSRFQGQAGFLSAAIMGAAAGLVAAPCSGPVLLTLVSFVAQARSIALGALLFFALALGLGTPYLVLGTFTGLINKVPRGGGYLLWFKKLLAFPILALVVYYLSADLKPWAWLAPALYAALALSAALYLGLLEGRSRQPWSRRFIAARAAALIVSASLAVWTGAVGIGPAVGPDDAGRPISWQPLSAGDLQAAAQARLPAVIYFTADWCSYCRTMERTVFHDAVVRRAAAGVRLLTVDLTNGNPSGEAAELYRQFVHGGPPLLVFYDRLGRAVAQRGPVNKDEFLRLLEQIRK